MAFVERGGTGSRRENSVPGCDPSAACSYRHAVDLDRLSVLFGADLLDAVEEIDVEDESGRLELIERLAPLPADTPKRDAQMALRTAALNQILDDDPPQTWVTARRLLGLGLDRDAVLTQLASVIGEHLSQALASASLFDLEAYLEALEELPWPDPSDIARCLIGIVRARPGILIDEHTDAAIAALGSPSGSAVESMVDEVLEDLLFGPLHWLPGDETVLVPDLVERATFTHRLTDAEVELQIVTAAFDLGAFSRFERLRLGDGSELEQFSVDRHHLAWRGPDGWLTHFEPGELLAVTVTVETDDVAVEPLAGTVAFEVVTNEPQVDDDAIASVQDGYEELIAELGLPVPGDELALWLLFHQPELFGSPAPPLQEMCAAAGLEQRGGRVAHDEQIWRNDVLRARSNLAFDLIPDREWRLAVARALEVLDDPEASVDDVRGVLDECAEPEALDVLADVLFQHHLDPADEFEPLDRADSPGRLFALVDRATAVARRPRETATAEYLACVLRERFGEPEIAEAHLRRAGEAQPRLGPIAERLGWYCFDRGDARGAMRWWRTLIEVPEAADILEPFLEPVPGSHKLGRNEPCWCGSGRKFKRCHQSATALPALPDRVGWLCRKASLWLDHANGDVRGVANELALAWATGDPDVGPEALMSLDHDEMFDALESALSDPIVLDAALHEAGLFKLFLHERAALLPEDEQLLSASWEMIERSVHEVVDIDPGVGMHLRDLRTGDLLDVRERTASTEARVGERYCARVVPDGASNQIIGGVFPVRTGHEEAVLDLCASKDAMALCAWAGALHQPPRVVHTPGLADEFFDRSRLDEVLADLDENSDPAEAMARLNEELARQAQNRWLEEKVPALGGLTPREAAADPTRREQLERLLDEFESIDERSKGMQDAPDGFFAFSYDVTALRRELGLI